MGHQLLGISFSDKVAKRIPKKWYLYGWLLVALNWISYRWKVIASKIIKEETVQSVRIYKTLILLLLIDYWIFFQIQVNGVVDNCQILSKSLSLLNSLVFLKQGKYPTLLHRALNLRTQLVNPDDSQSSDFSTLTRELLWHSFAVTSLNKFLIN